jgi:hypothetical protein
VGLCGAQEGVSNCSLEAQARFKRLAQLSRHKSWAATAFLKVPQTKSEHPYKGPVWIHGLELVLVSWSSTSHKVSKHEA